MVVDLSTYRCSRIGSFISRRGADAGRDADDGQGSDIWQGEDVGQGSDIGQVADVGRGAAAGQGAGWMKFFVSFCKLIKYIGSLTFIGMLLLMAGLESNPGPTDVPARTEPQLKWARVAYGYNYLKAGLTDFILGQIGQRHTRLKMEVHDQFGNVKPCSRCAINTLLPDHGTDGCNQKEGSICLCQQDPCIREECPNKFCGRFYHLIVNDHMEHSPRWSCTDPKEWYKDEFQYAKCFLSIDSSANSVSDLDCADLLTIVINNSYIRSSVHEVKSFQQCLKDHQQIFNRNNLEVTDSELNNYFEHMIHVLKCLSEDSGAQRAIDDLYKLKESSVEVSNEDIDKLLEKAKQNVFIFRYQYLLIEIGTNVLRHFFDERVNSDFRHYLKSKRGAENKLQDLINKSRVLTADQKKYLPPDDDNPSSSNFDISLLTCLLRNVCSELPAEHIIWTQPYGNSEEADIARLRICRNYLAHRDTVFISKPDFDDSWETLCGILRRLNDKCKNKIPDLQSLIDEAQNRCLNDKKSESLNKSMNDWEKGEQLDIIRQDINKMTTMMEGLNNTVIESQSKYNQDMRNVLTLLEPALVALIENGMIQLPSRRISQTANQPLLALLPDEGPDNSSSEENQPK